MKWFSFIFRHGLLVAVVVGIAIAYVYRYELFPRFFEQDTVTTVASKEAVKPDAKQSSDQASADQQTTQTSVEETPASISSDLSSNQPSQSVEQLSTEAKEIEKAQTDAAAVQTTADALQKPLAEQVTDSGKASVQTDDKASGQMQKDITDKAGPGLMTDPMSTVSGMIKNPAQSMSGMMNNPAQSSKQLVTGAEKPQEAPSVPAAPVQAPPYQSMNRSMASPPMSARMPARTPAQAPQYQPMNRPMASPPMSARMPAPAGTGSQAQQQVRQLISMARQAYWQGQYEQSENYYKQAIEAEPDNPDHYGELGNVYYAQGKWDESGENLYQSAIRLLDQNRIDKASNLLSIIQGLKHNRGAELETRLQSLQSKQTR